MNFCYPVIVVQQLVPESTTNSSPPFKQGSSLNLPVEGKLSRTAFPNDAASISALPLDISSGSEYWVHFFLREGSVEGVSR